MAHSKSATLPRKPHPDFPLTPRADGRWAKKIKGKVYIFKGTADQALAEYERVKPDLMLGRKARPKSDSLTVADLCNDFLTYKKGLREGGELAPRTYDRYYNTCKFLVQTLGQNTPVEILTSEDFQSLRTTMAKKWGPIALGNEVQIVRSVFRYGIEEGILDKAVRFGKSFKKPSAKTIRVTRAANGPKMFAPAQIKALLKAATPNMKAMILLGLNAGFGNTDLSELPMGAVDLKGGWVTYPRPKTGINRRASLWPETVKAIKAAMAKRSAPSDEADEHLLFIGKRGESYRAGHSYRVTQEFDRVAEKAKVIGRTFYDLRRTFQTVGEGANDLVAVQSIMGHAPASGDMSSVYRQTVSDERLSAVTEHVRRWLYGAEC